MKFRISNHKLNIETGRYEKISRFDRIYPVCGIEDEIHFLFNCPKYDYRGPNNTQHLTNDSYKQRNNNHYGYSLVN